MKKVCPKCGFDLTDFMETWEARTNGAEKELALFNPNIKDEMGSVDYVAMRKRIKELTAKYLNERNQSKQFSPRYEYCIAHIMALNAIERQIAGKK